jgi:hypothetical protein
MYIPPLTARTCPVIYDASSDARKHTAAATSSGVPSRPSGICAAQSFAASSVIAGHVRVDQPRRHHVHGDAPRRDFARQRLAEADEPGLRRRVVGLPGVAHLPDDRADADDPPAAASIIGLSRLRAARTRRQVGREHGVPVLALHAQQQLVARDAGVVDQDVERPVARRDGPPAAATPPVGDVERQRLGLPPAWPRSRRPPACAWSPRAAATTVAPCPASRARWRGRCRATHRHEATVPTRSIIATDASRMPASNARQARFGPSAARSSRRAPRVDLRTRPLSTVPGTHFNIRADALRRKPPHHVLPAHRRGHLRHERLDRRRRRRASARRRRWPRPAPADRRVRARAAPAPAGPRPASSARSGTARSPAAGSRARPRLGQLARTRHRRAPRRSRPGPARSGWPGSPPRPARPRARLRHAVGVEAEDRRHRAGRRPARPPACSGRGGARCAPRRRTSKVPAATCAEYSPRLCPATKRGASPREASRRTPPR